jgi:hypothetical protein
MSCWCGRQGFWALLLCTMYTVPSYRTHTTSTGHYTICCKNSQSCAPEDGQMFARNMLSWYWRSIKLLLLHLVGVPYLLYLHWWCTVKHKSSVEYCLFHTAWTCSKCWVWVLKNQLIDDARSNTNQEKMFLPNQNEIWELIYVSFFRGSREKRLLAYSCLSVRPSTWNN